MGKFTKASDLYRAQSRRFEELKLSRRSGHKDIVDASLEDARELTAGALTPKQTRGAFARTANKDGTHNPNGARRLLTTRQLKNRSLPGQVSPLPVNEQSHTLHDSFYIDTVYTGPYGQTFDLTQTDPGGGIFRLMPGGTKFMVDSGYETEIQKRWRARNKAFLDTYRAKQQNRG